MTAGQIVGAIDVITTLSQSLQAPANSIDIANGLLALIGEGPVIQVVEGFENITATATQDVTALQGVQPLSLQSDQDAVLDAFTEFVQVHQELLSIVIGKSGLLQDIAFGPPVTAVLRSLEGVVDTVALAIIGTLRDVDASQATTQKNDLDGTLAQAIDAFSPVQLPAIGL
ncbi:MAG: hypothetical protein M1838_004008 [Thelocarpon superellum]|nr:MAG: hypothetical protein M1838_004008 [Thelocarpon superellum]